MNVKPPKALPELVNLTKGALKEISSLPAYDSFSGMTADEESVVLTVAEGNFDKDAYCIHVGGKAIGWTSVASVAFAIVNNIGILNSWEVVGFVKYGEEIK